MKYTDIIHNEHFNNLTIILNIPFHAKNPYSDLHKRLKVEVPFWTLWGNFNKVTPLDGDWNMPQIIEAFTDLLVSVTTAAPELLWYTEDDLNWFFGTLDSEHGKVMVSLFKAWVSASHPFLTPGEVAEITGKSESNWRNRAAGQAGYKPIPGCRKPGKDWLIPLAVLQAQGDIPWSYRPDLVAEPIEE